MKKKLNTKRVSPPKSSGHKAYNKEALKKLSKVKQKIISTKKLYTG